VGRKLFELERQRITGEWRKLHNAELLTLCGMQNVIRVMKSRRMRLMLDIQVARMREMRNLYKILV
jgi:hypothetical protein